MLFKTSHHREALKKSCAFYHPLGGLSRWGMQFWEGQYWSTPCRFRDRCWNIKKPRSGDHEGCPAIRLRISCIMYTRTSQHRLRGRLVDILEGLNEQQRQAVTAPNGPVLVIAGPGSGKTRVLTHRIAYLIRERGVPPFRILAVTFTNKAAREMRERTEQLLGGSLRGATIGTFHSVCARILRQDGERVGLGRGFVIYDSADQRNIIRTVIRQLNLDDKLYPPASAHAAISRAKNELIPPAEFPIYSYRDEIYQRIYEAYQKALRANQGVDFDDLLMLVVQLLREHPDVREMYQRRWLHLLVDEFQDTNMAQYEIVRLLAGPERNVFVVGDEDQSIYAFRGADFRNVQRFKKDFPDATVILLEENYRSTPIILEAANAVISQNVHRTPKKLHTRRRGGPKIVIFEAYNEIEEAQFVVDEIARLVNTGEAQPGDIAVMYRTNAQSRALEEAFIARNMPYRLVGATRFYERREIKDVLAYLRIVHNPDDAISLNRIINVPPRRLGKRTVTALFAHAERQGISPYRVLHNLVGGEKIPGVGTAGERALLAFLDMWESWLEAREHMGVGELLALIINDTHYFAYLDDGTDEGRSRIENVQELIGVAETYDEMGPDGLTYFLEEVSLVSDIDELPEEVGAPVLLTLHMAKGLEFPVVFITGLEEGLLPHSRSLEDPEGLEEERRLFYVGMTRAKDRLYLLYTFRRTRYGVDDVNEPSRFLKDIPDHVVAERDTASSRRQQTIHRATAWETSAESGEFQRFRVGDRVYHKMFGEGIVMDVTNTRGDQELTVVFEQAGVKRLLASLAPLERR